MDIGYLDYCNTDAERETVKALSTGLSHNEYSKRIGLTRQSVDLRVKNVKNRAALAGYCPRVEMFNESIPDGFGLSKSTVHVKGGNVIQRWDRATQDLQEIEQKRREAMVEAAEGARTFKRIPKPTRTNKELLNLYTFADVHVGMYASEIESGQPYDLSIARSTVGNAFAEMIDRTPNSETGVLCLLGDWNHFDGLIAKTPKHGHPLDAAGRCFEICNTSASIAISLVAEMLKKHAKVDVNVVQGNHDEASSVWIQILLREVFRSNNRVVVPDIASPFAAMLHGRTMLGFHHGHKRKDDKLRDVFAGDPRYREMWGQAAYTYIHTGHCHSSYISEQGGAIVERHPTLSARDAYSSGGGYNSRRQARAITYHKDGGEHSRITVSCK